MKEKPKDGFEVVVTSYSSNKNLDAKIKKQSRTQLPKRQIFTQETVIAAEANTFCIKLVTHYLPGNDLKIAETLITVTKRNKLHQIRVF